VETEEQLMIMIIVKNSDKTKCYPLFSMEHMYNIIPRANDHLQIYLKVRVVYY